MPAELGSDVDEGAGALAQELAVCEVAAVKRAQQVGADDVLVHVERDPLEPAKREAMGSFGRLTCRCYGVCEIVGRSGIVEQVGRTPDAEGGVWRQGLVPLESRRVEPVAKSHRRVGELSVRHGSKKKSAVRDDRQFRPNHISARIRDRVGTVEDTPISRIIRQSTRRTVALVHALALAAVALTAAPADAR